MVSAPVSLDTSTCVPGEHGHVQFFFFLMQFYNTTIEDILNDNPPPPVPPNNDMDFLPQTAVNTTD